jgi:chemotaxis methyl-accepting protein methylase
MAVYEKFLFANKIQELITIREHNLSDQEDVLFVKGMDNIMVKNFI